MKQLMTHTSIFLGRFNPIEKMKIAIDRDMTIFSCCRTYLTNKKTSMKRGSMSPRWLAKKKKSPLNSNPIFLRFSLVGPTSNDFPWKESV